MKTFPSQDKAIYEIKWTEADMVTCKKCLQKKVRTVAGYWGKNKKLVDFKGSLWNGKTCPECNNTRISQHARKMRLNKASGVSALKA